MIRAKPTTTYTVDAGNMIRSGSEITITTPAPHGLNVVTINNEPHVTSDPSSAYSRHAVYIPPNSGQALPHGSYHVKSAFASALTLELFSRDQGVSAAPVTIDLYSDLQQAKDVVIRDIALDNTDRQNSGCVGLDMMFMYEAQVYNVGIRNCAIGIRASATDWVGSHYNDIYSASIIACMTAIKWHEGANENRFFGGRINDCLAGIYMDDVSGCTASDTTIESWAAPSVWNETIPPPTSGYGGNAAVWLACSNDGRPTSRCHLSNIRCESSATDAIGIRLDSHSLSPFIVPAGLISVPNGTPIVDLAAPVRHDQGAR
jgi:hypothetical protein